LLCAELRNDDVFVWVESFWVGARVELGAGGHGEGEQLFGGHNLSGGRGMCGSASPADLEVYFVGAFPVHINLKLDCLFKGRQ
jgi:hypothetical protein